jgi:hypothetical protein
LPTTSRQGKSIARIPGGTLIGNTFKPGVSTLADAERAHIISTLRDTNWVVGGREGAAARLGVLRTTLISGIVLPLPCLRDVDSSPRRLATPRCVARSCRSRWPAQPLRARRVPRSQENQGWFHVAYGLFRCLFRTRPPGARNRRLRASRPANSRTALERTEYGVAPPSQ